VIWMIARVCRVRHAFLPRGGRERRHPLRPPGGRAAQRHRTRDWKSAGGRPRRTRRRRRRWRTDPVSLTPRALAVGVREGEPPTIPRP